MAKIFEAIEENGHRGFCGPRAIAFLTGVPIRHAEKMLRRCRRGGYRDRNGRRLPIKGTYASEVLKVLERLGCKMEKLTVRVDTLGQFIEDTQHLDQVYLVNVTGHWVVVHKGTITDKLLRLKRRVQRAWRVEAPEQPKYKAPEPQLPKPVKPKPDIKQVRATRVEQQLKAWRTKLKRAQNAIKKLERKQRYYVQRVGQGGAEAV